MFIFTFIYVSCICLNIKPNYTRHLFETLNHFWAKDHLSSWLSLWPILSSVLWLVFCACLPSLSLHYQALSSLIHVSFIPSFLPLRKKNILQFELSFTLSPFLSSFIPIICFSVSTVSFSFCSKAFPCLHFLSSAIKTSCSASVAAAAAEYAADGGGPLGPLGEQKVCPLPLRLCVMEYREMEIGEENRWEENTLAACFITLLLTTRWSPLCQVVRYCGLIGQACK